MNNVDAANRDYEFETLGSNTDIDSVITTRLGRISRHYEYSNHFPKTANLQEVSGI